jgi:hypothetical protein
MMGRVRYEHRRTKIGEIGSIVPAASSRNKNKDEFGAKIRDGNLAVDVSAKRATLHFDPVSWSRSFRRANRPKRCGWITSAIVAGFAGTLTLGVANSLYAKSNRATAVLLTKAPTSVLARQSRSAGPVTTEVPTPTESSFETTAAVPATNQLPRTRPLTGPIVSLNPQPFTEFEELLGANIGDLSIDELANKVLVQGEAVAAAAGRADDFAWPRRDIVAAPSDPVAATIKTPGGP